MRKQVFSGTVNTEQACPLLDIGLNCTQAINEKCAKNAIFAERMFLPYPLIHLARAGLTDDSCFDQRFDELFNQDGKCSFQDMKE